MGNNTGRLYSVRRSSLGYTEFFAYSRFVSRLPSACSPISSGLNSPCIVERGRHVGARSAALFSLGAGSGPGVAGEPRTRALPPSPGGKRMMAFQIEPLHRCIDGSITHSERRSHFKKIWSSSPRMRCCRSFTALHDGTGLPGRSMKWAQDLSARNAGRASPHGRGH